MYDVDNMSVRTADSIVGSALAMAERFDPVELYHLEGRAPVLIICDHAGRRIPRYLGTLGLPEHEAQSSHRLGHRCRRCHASSGAQARCPGGALPCLAPGDRPQSGPGHADLDPHHLRRHLRSRQSELWIRTRSNAVCNSASSPITAPSPGRSPGCAAGSESR